MILQQVGLMQFFYFFIYFFFVFCDRILNLNQGKRQHIQSFYPFLNLCYGQQYVGEKLQPKYLKQSPAKQDNIQKVDYIFKSKFLLWDIWILSKFVSKHLMSWFLVSLIKFSLFSHFSLQSDFVWLCILPPVLFSWLVLLAFASVLFNLLYAGCFVLWQNCVLVTMIKLRVCLLFTCLWVPHETPHKKCFMTPGRPKSKLVVAKSQSPCGKGAHGSS